MWIFHESFFDDAFRRRIEISVGKCLSLFSSKFVHWIWKVHINKDWSISPNALTVSELFWRPSLAAAWCSAEPEEVDVVAGQNKDRYRKVRRMWCDRIKFSTSIYGLRTVDRTTTKTVMSLRWPWFTLSSSISSCLPPPMYHCGGGSTLKQ